MADNALELCCNSLFTRQGVQSALDKHSSQFPFLIGGQFCVAHGMDNTTAPDDAIRAYCLGHQSHGRDLSHGDSGLLDLGCDRSAAASAGSSS
jgi:hypothetical protein